jgi:hypothetical protein
MHLNRGIGILNKAVVIAVSRSPCGRCMIRTVLETTSYERNNVPALGTERMTYGFAEYSLENPNPDRDGSPLWA